MLWYARVQHSSHRRERVLPTGRVQVILNLACDLLHYCPDGKTACASSRRPRQGSARLSSFLLQNFAARISRHGIVGFAIDRFQRTPSVSTVREVARSAGWSERRCSQVFREQVSLSPKAWTRIQRFQRAVACRHRHSLVGNCARVRLLRSVPLRQRIPRIFRNRHNNLFGPPRPLDESHPSRLVPNI
jgi:AraC-like DNA-binding protein